MMGANKGKDAEEKNLRFNFCEEKYKKLLISETQLYKLLVDKKLEDKNSQSKIERSIKNIPNLKIINENGTNVYDLLKYKNVIFTTSSIKSFQERVTKWKNYIKEK